jgi:chemotaxis protein MotB
VSDDAPKEPELVFKKVKLPGAAAHGGAWKVAFADFVTAMMAFFLLLWLLNATTQEQLEGISNYFEPVGVRQGSSGSGGLFGGISATEPGPIPKPAAPTEIKMSMDSTPGDKATNEESPIEGEVSDLPNLTQIKSDNEAKQFRAAEAALEQALDQVPELRHLREAIKIDTTDRGLRIQLIDQNGVSMFKPGGAELTDHTEKILILIASVVERLPNKLSISGHTDAQKFASSAGRTNWELSFDRAIAARRALQRAGLPNKRTAEVVAKADTELRFKDKPLSPGNRRLEIVLLRDRKDPNAKSPAPPRIFGNN